MSDSPNHIHLKKEILIRLVKAFFSDDFGESTRLIPYDMRPKGSEVPYRCCIHKERAILRERTLAGLGFAMENNDDRRTLASFAKEALEREAPEKNPLTILGDACKGCVSNRVYVTDLCQGCVARPCQSACKFDAISMVDGHSYIDPAKCRKCKMCIPTCPYGAIVKIMVPCEESCPVGAIMKGEDGRTMIDFEKCISCGKCVSACPFGAVHEKSQIIDILKSIKKGKKVIAMIAPAVVGQFPGTVYQLKTAMLRAGFSDVYEVAHGADTTTRNEAKEFEERMAEGKSFMTTSCCAAYNNLVAKHLPMMKPFVSSTHTPLYYTAEYVRQKSPDCVSVFISPCVAKRTEGMDNANVDYVMTFEELGALFVGRQIEILECEETPFEDESSKQGRGFGVTAGVAGAVSSLAVDVKPHCINGLTKASVTELKVCALKGSCPDGNLIEVMSCVGGCVGGNATLNRTKTAAKIIDGLLEKSEDLKK